MKVFLRSFDFPTWLTFTSFSCILNYTSLLGNGHFTTFLQGSVCRYFSLFCHLYFLIMHGIITVFVRNSINLVKNCVFFPAPDWWTSKSQTTKWSPRCCRARRTFTPFTKSSTIPKTVFYTASPSTNRLVALKAL